MEKSQLEKIIEIQGQIIEIRRGAFASTDPAFQEMYLTIADLMESLARELDRVDY
jgi:hypothetical protein